MDNKETRLTISDYAKSLASLDEEERRVSAEIKELQQQQRILIEAMNIVYAKMKEVM